jgi:MarR family transcriptional regulator for hemolysin
MERLGRQLYLTWKAAHDRLDSRLGEVGGSISQWVVLRVLVDEPALSHRDLARRLELTGATLTHHLDRLESEGYIERIRDTGDRRVVRVEVTPVGKARFHALDAIAVESDDALRALLSEREATTLVRVLSKLHARLGDHPSPQGDHDAP